MTNGAPPPVPGSAPAKKGMSPWAWVAIGCGAIVVIGFIVFMALGVFVFKKTKDAVHEATGGKSLSEMAEEFKDNPTKAAAETMVRVNPELELVSTDDDAGTITFRNTKTGEEATLNFEDAAEGRFSMTTDEGEFSVDASNTGEEGVTFKGPDGEIRYGGSADLSDVPDWVPSYPGATNAQSTMHSTSATGMMGAFTATTTDDAQTVIDHFKQVFEDGGYAVGTESLTKTADGAFGAVTGELKDDGRSVNVVIMESKGESRVTINYNEKKP